MCVICVLHAGYTPPYSYIYNACHNNPDGYGLVIKREGRLDVVRELPEGGNDPEAIYKLLKDTEEFERVLHVRYRTQGEVSMANTQPFTVFKNDTRHQEFMHNGTLTAFSGSHYSYGQNTQGQKESDSKRFAEEVLMKYLPKLHGEKGVADVTDPLVGEMLDKYWSSGNNRGIIISNDLDNYYFNVKSWEIIKTTETVDGVEVQGSFFASNNDYFDRVKRGPLFTRMEEEARKKREQEQERVRLHQATKSQTQTGKATSVGPGLLSEHGFSAKYGISDKAGELLNDLDFYTPEGYIALGNMTYYEMLKAVTEMGTEDVTGMLMYLTEFLKTNTENLEKSNAKLSRATRKIGELRKEIGVLTERVEVESRHAA